MLPAGIGTDIVSIARVREARYPDRIAELILSPAEYHSYSVAPDRSLYLASRFALKEAIIKACPVPVRACDVEVQHVGNRPVCVWRFQPAPQYDILLSLSHEQTYAVAVACAVPRGD